MNWQKIILPTTCTCLLPSIKWTKANHQCVTIRTGSENNLCNFSTDAPVSSWSRRNLTNHTPPPPGPNSRVMGTGLVKRRVSAQHLALVFFLWTSHSLTPCCCCHPSACVVHCTVQHCANVCTVHMGWKWNEWVCLENDTFQNNKVRVSGYLGKILHYWQMLSIFSGLHFKIHCLNEHRLTIECRIMWGNAKFVLEMCKLI